MKKAKIEKDTPQTSRAAGVIFCITGVIFLLMYSINSGWFWCLSCRNHVVCNRDRHVCGGT